MSVIEAAVRFADAIFGLVLGNWASQFVADQYPKPAAPLIKILNRDDKPAEC
jgi:hypothetical protein